MILFFAVIGALTVFAILTVLGALALGLLEISVEDLL